MNVLRRLSRPPLWGLIVAAVLAVAIPAYAASGGSGGSGKATAAAAPLANLLPPSIRKAGSLVIATDASYPPCEYFPKPGAAMVGFEPDLWNAMGALLGVKIKPVNTAFDGLIPGVQSGRYPVAMECISDSVAREKQRANDSEIGRLAFPSFLRSIDARRENLRATLKDLEREHATADAELAVAFQDLKSLEFATEQQQKRNEELEARRDESRLEEMALVRHLRKHALRGA